MEEISNNQNSSPNEALVSRRVFLGLMGLAGADVLVGCAPANVATQPTVATIEPVTPSPTATEQQIAPTPEPSSEYIKGMAWERDFSLMPNGPLNPEEWNFTTGTLVPGYNSEEQTYTNRQENARIENGLLVIEARNENLDNREFTSARIDTRNKFAFTYGKIEVTAMLPRGVGTWPAAWLLPTAPIYDPQKYGISEEHRYNFAVNGEVDFLEAIGSIENTDIPTAHSFNQRNSGQEIYTPGFIDDAYGAFHTYGVIKKPGSLEFMIDGQVYASRLQESESPLDWPFEQEYYLILNLAMGGPWAGREKENFPPYGIDTSMSDKWQYKIQKINYTPL
jgi:beta-glucanase (GH16 family)